jgi:hypothetical protein
MHLIVYNIPCYTTVSNHDHRCINFPFSRPQMAAYPRPNPSHPSVIARRSRSDRRLQSVLKGSNLVNRIHNIDTKLMITHQPTTGRLKVLMEGWTGDGRRESEDGHRSSVLSLLSSIFRRRSQSSVSIQCAASFRTTQCAASLEHSGTPVAQRKGLKTYYSPFTIHHSVRSLPGA